jgi:porin
MAEWRDDGNAGHSREVASGFAQQMRSAGRFAPSHRRPQQNESGQGWRIAPRQLNGVAVALATLLAVNGAHAEDPAAKTSDETTAAAAPVPWLLGDWGGYRTRLQQDGVDLQLGYTSEIAINTQGGTDKKARYTDQWTFGTTLDLDRLLGLHDARFQITFTDRNGRNLSDDAHLGTLQQVQEVFGRGQTWRLTQFWFDQKYFDGLLDWKVGRLGVGEDFASFACDFQNLTFCGSDPGNLVGNYIFNWPVSQWATRLKVALDDFGYVQIGAYDINPKYLNTDAEDALLPVFFSDSTGVMLPVEVAWLPQFANGTLPGSYKFGVWVDTSDASDVVNVLGTVAASNPGVPVDQDHGRFGGYINFEQQVTRTATENPKGGLRLFLNAVFADDRTATTDRQIAGGLLYTGPFSSRPDDDIAFAVGTTHVNDRVADAQALGNGLGLGPTPVQHSEYVFELYYTLRPVSGLLFRPNLQYILDPGGTSHNEDAFVMGLKVGADF